MQVDHVFWCVEDAEAAAAWVERLGLRETYRRRHVGQGTANVCCAFDNAYLELLWVVDPDEARGPQVTRTRLADRGAWRHGVACPVGVAVRGGLSGVRPTWTYAPPYLPPGVTIDVLEGSGTPEQPLVFSAPGLTPPAEWPEARRGSLQRDLGRAGISRIELTAPGPLDADVAAVLALAGVVARSGPAWALELTVELASAGAERLTLG
jgi:hypothetical protein